jgi:hypothetical protein
MPHPTDRARWPRDSGALLPNGPVYCHIGASSGQVLDRLSPRRSQARRIRERLCANRGSVAVHDLRLMVIVAAGAVTLGS